MLHSPAHKLRKLIIGRPPSPSAPIDISIERADQVLPYLYWTEDRPIRFLLPASMLRMQGAFSYGGRHPFLAALKEGDGALSAFYASFQPSNLAEMYGFSRSGRTGEDLPPWELPWLMRQDRSPPPGESGLAAHHGVSYYGPATREKVALESKRLVSLSASVREKGYVRRKCGDIQGHFLRNDRGVVFFVRGGKHRAAVLTHLGADKIPVQVRRTWPAIVDSGAVDFWPLVTSGAIDRTFALDILDVYVGGK